MSRSGLVAAGCLVALVVTNDAMAEGARVPGHKSAGTSASGADDDQNERTAGGEKPGNGDDDGVDAAPQSPPVDPKLAQAREHFTKGAEAVANADWAEALLAFERSAQIRPHPITTFNIAVCQRALGQYARARLTFQDALDTHHRGAGGKLSEALLAQAKKFAAEIDALLATVQTQITPPGARLSVDGRPLRKVMLGGTELYFAGVRPPGPGAEAPRGAFAIVADPGARVFTVRHPGFDEVVVTRTLPPGSTDTLALELSRLPAKLHIESNRPGAVVTLDALDVGVAPVSLTRPAGGYEVVVRKPGFVTYETHVSLKPGEQANLRANLPQVEPALTDKWWFWTAAGVVVVGAAVTTYALTRPDPERPPPDGGTLGWVVDVR